MKRFLIILTGLFALCLESWATSIATPAQAAMDVLGQSLEYYAAQHGGQLPAKLSDLDPYLVQSVEKQLGGGPLDENVMLVNNRGVEMVTPNKNEVFTGGQILAVTASSIGEDRREESGRYVIWKNSKGRFRASWLDESAVETQFVKAGVKLPSGAFLQQPSTLDASPEYIAQKYADENFKDPKNPTAQEIEKMKQVFAERYSDKQPATPAPTAFQATSAMSSPSLSTSRPAASATPTATGAAKESPAPSFPIVPVAVIAAVIVGVIVFLLRRK